MNTTTVSRGSVNLALQGLQGIRRAAADMTPAQRMYYVSLEAIDAAIAEITALDPPAPPDAEQLKRKHGEVVEVLGEHTRTATSGGFKATGYRFADGHVEAIR